MCKEGGVSRGASKSGKSPGIGFAGLAKTIAVKWKEIPSRTPYTAQAAIEKDRYNKEIVVWRAKLKDEKKKAEKEKALLVDDNQDTGAARREDSAAYSPARMNSSEAATYTDVPHVAETPRLSLSSHDQSIYSGLVASRRPEHGQYPLYGQSSEENFDSNFDLLLAFEEREGHVRVPIKHQKRDLGAWLAAQGSLYRHGLLELDRQKWLEVAGVTWETEETCCTQTSSARSLEEEE